jgi:hypothetical protein
MPEQHPSNPILLAFAPQLGLAPGDFARAWNADPACAQAGRASVEPAPGQNFSLGGLEVAVLTVAGSILTGLATNALYDLIKMQLEKLLASRSAPERRPRLRITLTETRLPDGARVLAITAEEEA